MNILFATSEMNPLAATGGLGDVAGSLPAALRGRGIDIRVIMPLYKKIKQTYRDSLRFIRWSMINLGWRTMYSGLFTTDVGGVPIYFIDNDFYFGHDNLYIDYSFDVERFAFFQRAVLEAMGDPMGFQPDLLHLNDWQTAMMPVLLESHYQRNGYHKDVHSLITIHNLKYQGIHGHEVVQDLLDLPDDYMTDDKVLLNGVPNFMKAGITYASRVTTVSPTYAREIMTDYYGEGLDGVLRDQGWKVQGILNGIDIDLYNPAKDPAIPSNYSDKAWIRGKGRCKAALQQEAGLSQKSKTPLISMVTRLAQQKGIDLLVRILDELLEEDVQFILLGSGEPNYERSIREIEARHPDRMRAYIMFDPLLARRIYAGSDIFLMPSLFEPCGLSQMIAMRYGTLPIVRQTGGLADTVQPYNRYDQTGNGFGFLNINAHELLFTTKDAVQLYTEEPAIWKKLVHQAMTGDYSWDRSAQSYEQLYRDILEETR